MLVLRTSSDVRSFGQKHNKFRGANQLSSFNIVISGAVAEAVWTWEQYLLYTLDRTPPLTATLIARRISSRRVQDADTHLGQHESGGATVAYDVVYFVRAIFLPKVIFPLLIYVRWIEKAVEKNFLPQKRVKSTKWQKNTVKIQKLEKNEKHIFFGTRNCSFIIFLPIILHLYIGK